MQLFLDCLPCLLRQVLEAALLASADEAAQGRIMDEAIATLAEHQTVSLAPAMAQKMHAIVKRHSGLVDPYQGIKERDMQAALRLKPSLSRFIETSTDPLFAALKVSATGNVMDSALYSDLDIEACITAELERPFTRCDLDAFASDLAAAKVVLIVGDNAGEAVFDTLLARELARDHEVIFAVRGQPIINDVTEQDAHFVGMDAHATIVSTGCPAPGAILDACSDDFRALFDGVDLVISKGQGNFEALSDAPRPLYFLLKAKCPKIARALGVDVGDYVFRAGGDRDGRVREGGPVGAAGGAPGRPGDGHLPSAIPPGVYSSHER